VEEGAKLHMKSSIICILEQTGNHLKEDEIGEAYSTHGRDNKCVQKLNRTTCVGETIWECNVMDLAEIGHEMVSSGPG
jgi:hypothetical protein